VITANVPEPDDVTGPWWEATRERRLIVQRCSLCDGRQHPPRAVCISCGRAEGLEWLDSAEVATVDTWTVVHRSPVPDMPTPYVIARVRLDEGPVLLTRLEPDLEWRIGDRVTVRWADLADGRALPIFTRAPGGSSHSGRDDL
jgi:uncharacterized protein